MSTSSTQQIFDQALAHQQAGRLREADQLYRQILQAEPNHVGALHFFGILHAMVGSYPTGIELIRRAIVLKPNWLEAHTNLAKVLLDSGHLEAAAQACHQALALRPDFPDAHNLLGVILRLQGRLDESIASCHKAIAARPNFPEAFANLSAALKEQGHFDQAVNAASQAISLRPNYAEAHNNLGLALQAQNHLDEALSAYRQAITLNPNLAEAHNNLGDILRKAKQYDPAIAACRRAIALNPNFAEAYNNLGIAFSETNQLDEAISNLLRAIELKPDAAHMRFNLGVAYNARAQFDDAQQQYRSALALNANHGEARYAIGELDLLRGDFAQGWPEFESRTIFLNPSSRKFSQPLWDGSDLNGRPILLHAEFGFGDAIQFFRYWPLVAARGGKILIQCYTPLKRLFQLSAPGCDIFDQNDSLPAFDCHCPLMSLPRVFKTDLSSIPEQPYLRSDAAQVATWKSKTNEIPAFKIGLVWQGNPKHENDRNRSIPLSTFAPLANIPGLKFISLQKGVPADALSQSPIPLIDWTSDLNDFADTAALIANLDLVISVDTAVAHLTGAIGKPIWTLLPHVPDWRWLLERPDSPWYPSMRLFRQTSCGDWRGVIERVTEALRDQIAHSSDECA